jgi:hypothetical protein
MTPEREELQRNLDRLKEEGIRLRNEYELVLDQLRKTQKAIRLLRESPLQK